MATVSTLAFKILADSKQFTDGMAATKKELRIAKQLFEETRSPLEQYQARMDGLAALHRKGAIDQETYSRAQKKLTEGFREQQNASSSLHQAASQLGVSLNPTTLGIGAAVAGFAAFTAAVGTAANALIDLGQQQFAAIDAMGDTINKLGLGAEGYQVLRYATSQAGVETGALENALTKLARSSADAVTGGKKTAAAFRELGIESESLRGLSADEVFQRVAVGMQGIGDANERARLAMQLFGKSGAEMLNLLDLMATDHDAVAEAARRAGVVLSTDNIAAVQAADDAMQRFHKSVEGLGNTLAVEFADPLRMVVDGLNEMATSKVFQETTWGVVKAGIKSIADAITGNPILNSLVGRALGNAAGGFKLANQFARQLNQDNADRKRANAAASVAALEAEGGEVKSKDRYAARKLEKELLAGMFGYGTFDNFSKKLEAEREKERKAKTLEGQLAALTGPLKGLTAPEEGFKSPEAKKKDRDKNAGKDFTVSEAFRKGSVEAFGATLKNKEAAKQLEYAKRQNELAQRQLEEQTKANVALEKLAASEAIA